jgi:hypothetical protein
MSKPVAALATDVSVGDDGVAGSIVKERTGELLDGE